MTKRLLLLMLVTVTVLSFSACGKKNEVKVKQEISSEVNIDEVPLKNLISGYAFETGVEEDGTLESYVFFADSKLYYFGSSNKIGTWSLKGNTLTVHYTSADGAECDETQELTVEVESEIGVRINGADFMMIDTAENYISA